MSREELGNGRTAIIGTHLSKRGRAYKRRRIVKSVIDAPGWYRR